MAWPPHAKAHHARLIPGWRGPSQWRLSAAPVTFLLICSLPVPFHWRKGRLGESRVLPGLCMAESRALYLVSTWHVVTAESFLIAGESHTKEGAVGGMVDSKTYIRVPEPMNGASLGKGVLADVMKGLEMMASRITWEGSESNDNCPCKRQTEKRPTERRVRWRQRLDICC